MPSTMMARLNETINNNPSVTRAWVGPRPASHRMPRTRSPTQAAKLANSGHTSAGGSEHGRVRVARLEGNAHGDFRIDVWGDMPCSG